jgi:hypothetical protein
MFHSSATPGESWDIAAVSGRANVPKFNKSLLLRRFGNFEQLEL